MRGRRKGGRERGDPLKFECLRDSHMRKERWRGKGKGRKELEQ